MATNTVPTFTNHTGNGTAGPFNIGFNYIDKSEVIVRVNEVLKSTPTHYTFNSNTQITFTSGNEPASGLNIEFRRSTNITTAKVDFQDGSVLTETDLDANTNQLLFALQENTDAVNADNLESSSIYLRDGSRTLTGNIVFEGSTKDAHETTLTPVDPTADRTINIPNVSGTLVTTGDIGTVTTTMIADGTFVNADINANAAIAGTKVSPNFGSQNISTTGNVTATNFIGNGSQLTGITFTGIDQFLRRDIDDTASGNITFNKNIFIPNHAGTSNVFNDSDVLDTGNLIFGPTPDTTSSDPMQFNNYIYHSTLNSNTEPTTVLQLGTTSSSSTRFGSFTIKGNNETLVTFTKEFGSFFEEKINIPHTNTEGIIFSNHSINNNPKIPSLQIKSNDPSSNTPDSFINCKRGNLNIACGVNGTGTVIKDVDTNGPNTIAVFKSDIGNNSGDAFHKGAVELYSEGTKRFETNSTGAKVTGTLDVDDILLANSIAHEGQTNTKISFDGTSIKFTSNGVDRLSVTQFANFIASGHKQAFIASSGENPFIRSTGTNNGDLEIGQGTDSMAQFKRDGSVELYYDNVKKAETSSTGFDVTGTLKAINKVNIHDNGTSTPMLQLTNSVTGTDTEDGFRIGYSTNSNVAFFIAGESNSAFQIKTGGSAANDERLNISNTGVFTVKSNSEDMLIATPNAGVELYHNNVKKLETTSDGAKVTGILEIISSGTNPEILLAGAGPNSIRFTSNDAPNDNTDTIDLVYRATPNTLGFERVSDSKELFLVDVDTEEVKIPTDTGKLQLGANQELEFYHTGANSFINKTGTGNLKIKSNQTDIVNDDNTDFIAKFIGDDAVWLYYDGSRKFQTTSYGVLATGTIVTLTGNVRCQSDSHKITVGASNDLEIYHNGTNSFIENTVGNLHIRPKDNEEGIKLNPDGGVLLYHDNALKFQTTANGWRCDDNVKGLFGTSGDLAIYHDGSNSIIQDNGAGELLFNRGSNTILSLNDLGIEVTDPNGTAVVSIKGFEGSNARLELKADEGDDAGDTWRIQSQANNNDLTIFNNTDGVDTYSTKWRLNTAGTVIQQGDLKLFDNGAAMFGGTIENSGDLQIFHDGTHSNIENATGELKLNCRSKIRLEARTAQLADETMLLGTLNGAVELYYDNVKRFETLSTGTKSTGNTHTFQGGGSDVSLTVASSQSSSAETTLVLRGSRTSSTTLPVSKIDFTTNDNADTSVYDSTMPLGSIKMFKQQGNTNRGRLKIDLNNVSGDNSATVFDLESDGDLTITGTYSPSDSRLKTDIITISDALTKVNNLRGVEYTRIKTGRKEIGVIAQEVQAVIPEIVKTDNDEDKTLKVNYGHLTAALIEAIKELSAKVKVLESNI